MNLKIKIGCDIVELQRFSQILEKGNKTLLNNLFTPHEISNANSIKNLAGIFAAKESVIKALQLEPGSWQTIEIIKLSNGKPTIKIYNFEQNIISQDLSISHDGNYVIANAVFLISE